MIPQDSKDRVFEYIFGAMKTSGCLPLVVGGMTDHVHILSEIPPKFAISEIIHNVKICTSKWINMTLPNSGKFAWQEGFGSFTVSASKKDIVFQYIQNQEKHHQSKSFKEEFIELLNMHGVKFEEKYLWK